jgi:hypothetical protein
MEWENERLQREIHRLRAELDDERGRSSDLRERLDDALEHRREEQQDHRGDPEGEERGRKRARDDAIPLIARMSNADLEAFPPLPTPSLRVEPAGPSLRDCYVSAGVTRSPAQAIIASSPTTMLMVPPAMQYRPPRRELDARGFPTSKATVDLWMNLIQNDPNGESSRHVAATLSKWVAWINHAIKGGARAPDELERHVIRTWVRPRWMARTTGPDDPLRMPDSSAAIEDWIRYLTRYPHTKIRGIVPHDALLWHERLHRKNLEGFLAVSRLAPSSSSPPPPSATVAAPDAQSAPTSKDRQAFTRIIIQLCLTGDYDNIRGAVNRDVASRRSNRHYSLVQGPVTMDNVVKHLAASGVTVAEVRTWTDFALTWARSFVHEVRPSEDHPIQAMIDAWRYWKGEPSQRVQVPCDRETALIPVAEWDAIRPSQPPAASSATQVGESLADRVSGKASQLDAMPIDEEVLDYGSDDGVMSSPGRF